MLDKAKRRQGLQIKRAVKAAKAMGYSCGPHGQDVQVLRVKKLGGSVYEEYTRDEFINKFLLGLEKS